MLIADYHMHTNFSSDCKTPMESMIQSSIEKGLKEIAITDHFDYDDRYPVIDYNKYIITFNQLKEKYAENINIVFGIEIGMSYNFAEEIKKFTNSFPFEFIICSSHQFFGQDLYLDDCFKGKEKKEAYTEYFTAVLKNTQCIDDYNVYGHLDFVNRYSNYDDNTLEYKDYSDIIDEILKTIIESGKGIEINTSGYRYKLNRTHPSTNILKRYKELGGEIITVGSDAHFAKDIAEHFDTAYEILKNIGFKYITLFRNRKPVFEKIDK